ncbi:hypothetical protein [Pseudoxanthomonas indica]|uniref:Uncharacterized protein n=1 Tax=Pseudoxanthomonas indica TaxID=428993 RepID=A0A1T5JEW6_9GAMM|nr:hypothetical protein [Pseudoxanthomonas indica]GGD58304.1 hypothetical protein GCM10007235_33310 [Pseudoxanthomonas indica]SKC50000.1 hypothetical protein SAMN06296058_0751 [Pseudoxanthomonas indica]
MTRPYDIPMLTIAKAGATAALMPAARMREAVRGCIGQLHLMAELFSHGGQRNTDKLHQHATQLYAIAAELEQLTERMPVPVSIPSAPVWAYSDRLCFVAQVRGDDLTADECREHAATLLEYGQAAIRCAAGRGQHECDPVDTMTNAINGADFLLQIAHSLNVAAERMAGGSVDAPVDTQTSTDTSTRDGADDKVTPRAADRAAPKQTEAA